VTTVFRIDQTNPMLFGGGWLKDFAKQSQIGDSGVVSGSVVSGLTNEPDLVRGRTASSFSTKQSQIGDGGLSLD
jgi:hypothetical protein